MKIWNRFKTLLKDQRGFGVGEAIGVGLLGDAIGTTAATAVGTGLVGAAAGAGVSALTGGNVGTGALLGGLTGGVGSLAGSAIGGASSGLGGFSSIFDSSPSVEGGLASSFDGSPITWGDGALNSVDEGAGAGVNLGNSALTQAAQGAAPSADGSAIAWNNDLTAPGQSPSTMSKIVNAITGSGSGSGPSASSGILGKNPLASLGILASGASSLMTSQANQDALAKQQAAQQQFNQSQSNLVNNFTPLNRQLSVTPQSVGNLNNYGQAGYTGWNGTGGNQLFYNNVNPASYNGAAPATTTMKSGGAVKNNYATGGAAQTNPMHNGGPSLASILSAMAQSAPPAVANRPQEPLTTQLSNQIYPRQVSPVESGNYARGGAVKHPKGLQVSKTTQLTLPATAIAAQPQAQSPMLAPAMNSTSSGIEGLPQGLAGGGMPKLLNRQQRPMGMPMQTMPNRIPTNTSGMMSSRLNPNNPNLNLSPLRMMAKGGFLSGDTDGHADKIDVKLSDGEYVIPARVVADLGGGNNSAGAKVLDNMVKNVRIHKNTPQPKTKGGKGKLEPKTKPIVQYMKKRKVKV